MHKTDEYRRYWRQHWQTCQRNHIAYLTDWAGFLKYGGTVGGWGWVRGHYGPEPTNDRLYPPLTAGQEADAELHATRQTAGMNVYVLTKLVCSTAPMLITNLSSPMDFTRAKESWLSCFPNRQHPDSWHQTEEAAEVFPTPGGPL